MLIYFQNWHFYETLSIYLSIYLYIYIYIYIYIYRKERNFPRTDYILEIFIKDIKVSSDMIPRHRGTNPNYWCERLTNRL